MKNIRPQIPLVTGSPRSGRSRVPKVVVAGVLTRRSATLRRTVLLFTALLVKIALLVSCAVIVMPLIFASAIAATPAVINTSMTADTNPVHVEVPFQYKITVTNTGGSPATNITIHDTLPAGVELTDTSISQGAGSYDSGTNTATCALGTINSGDAATCFLTVVSHDEGTLNNTATVTGDWDHSQGNDSASVNGLQSVRFVDLDVSMTASADLIPAGANVTYTIVVKNLNGPLDATGVTLTDSLPAPMQFVSATTTQGSLVTPPVGSSGTVTANIGTLAPDDSATFTVTVKSSSPGTFLNSATGSSNEQEDDSSNNTGSVSTDVARIVVVNSTADPGDGTCDAAGTGDGCTLREAVTDANNDGVPSLIAFSDGSGGSTNFFDGGQHTITLTSGQLVVGNSVNISGPGAANLAVDGNQASRVLYISPGKTVMISGLTIRNGLDGSGGAGGGGIYNDHGTLTVTNSTVTLNHADDGGGIYNEGSQSGGSATLTITNSTVSLNTSNHGGGVYNAAVTSPGSATLTVINSTLSGNFSKFGGGGVYNDGSDSGSATVTIKNSTLSGNTGTFNGGVSIYNDPGFIGDANSTIKIGGTILNAGASEENISDQLGTVTSDGYNLSSDDGGGFLTATTDKKNTDPKLGPLQDNGGPTFTHALLPGSPAIDKGKDLSGTGTDQRGGTRPIDDPNTTNASGGDGSDIGAVEVVTHVVTNTNNSGAGSLRQALADSFDGDAIYFDPSVNGQAITPTSGELLVDKSVTITGPGAANLAVDGNAASGIFHISPDRTVVISGLTIRNGKTSGFGGGIHNDHATLTLKDSVVTLNSGPNGGGIANNGAGGSASLTVTNSTLSGNSATDAFGTGGGILNFGNAGSATLVISNSTLSGNSAPFGGGIYSSSSSGSTSVTISNSTLSGNLAPSRAGGIMNDGSFSGNAVLALTNCTLSGNSSPSGASIANDAKSGTATVQLGNTILKAAALEANITNAAGVVTSNGYNLSSDAGVTNSNGGTGALNATGDQVNTDPQLGPLADYGGPTFTHALLPGSPAIDKGKDLSGTSKDQRGKARPFDDPSTGNASGGDNSDIGAFELTSKIVTNNQDSGAGSLRGVLADPNVLDGDAIYFDPSLNGLAITLTSGELLVNKSVAIAGPGANQLAVDGNANGRVFHISPGKTVAISGLTVTNGKVSGSGGGIYIDHGTLTLSNSTLRGNSATSSGGAIFNNGFNGGSATLTVSNSTLSGNSAQFAGAIFNDGETGSATLTINNSTLSGNSSSSLGGAIYNHGSFGGNAMLAINNSTFSDNSGTGGGIYNRNSGSNGSATVTIGSTILKKGGTLGYNIFNLSGTVTSLGYNLSSDGGVFNNGGTGSLNATGDQTNTDPKLAPLGDNGGPTFTHALLVGSPAIDKGKDLTNTGIDQRGRSRAFDEPSSTNGSGDKSDIGAFELVTHKVTNNQDSVAGSLRQALLDSLDGDAIYFDPSLNGQAIVLSSGELFVDKNVAISGPGAANLAVDGNHVSRVFTINQGKTATISGLTIRNGAAGGASGGGIYNDGATLTVTDCVVTLNQANQGGGIFNSGYYRSATLTIANSTLSGNTADFAGGGIHNFGEQHSATLTISNSTLSGNATIPGFHYGGAVYSDGYAGSAPVTITNSTLSGNSSTIGSAILNDGRNSGSAAVTITNSTLSNNSNSDPSGGIHIYGSGGSATVTLGNTILNGSAGIANIVNDGGTVTSNGYNLSNDVGVFNFAGSTGAFDQPGDQVNTDPRLGPLQDNGGPAFTHALLPGSPALDAGDNTLASNAGLTTDQRGPGFGRTLDAASDADTTQTVDIGAFEADPSIEDIANKSTAEDTPLSFIFKVGDSATPFDSNSVTATSSNTTLLPNGNLVVDFDTDSTRKLTMTPAANQYGTTTITVTVTKTINGAAVSMSDTFLLTVTAGNDAPTANPQSISTNEDTAKAITLTGGDIDGDALTYSVVTGPAHGSLSGTAPNLNYKPNANYHGADSFTFKANDGHVDSNVATISITVAAVNDAPTANPQSVSTNEDTAKAITLMAGDVEGDALTYSVVTGPAHGILSGTPPNLSYKPNTNYHGPDSFTFKANDSHVDSNVATISITVTSVNDAPTANPQSVSTNEDTAKAITLTGGDIDGDALTYSVVTGPAHGSLSGTAPNLTYKPNANYNGADSFTFKANDSHVDSNVAAVSITVAAVNDAPTANPQSLSTNEDTAKAITLTARDVDGDALTYGIVTLPAHGLLSGTAPNLTYTPSANYNGPDSFTFKANDGSANSNAATISINVLAVNDPPSFTKGPDQTVPENSGAHSVANWAKSISAGPANEAGQTLSFIVTNNSNNSVFSSQPAISSNGTLTYTLAANAHGSATVTVVLKDNGGTANGGKDSSAPQTFTITITATPTPTPSPTPTATATATPTATATATATATPTATAKPGVVANVSTRLPAGTGDNALIVGFIVDGPSGSIQKILVRAIGPSLIPFGIADALANPTLGIFNSGTAQIASNDDWKTTQIGGIITNDQATEINGSGLAPNNELESAIVANLTPGAYTAVVKGAGDTVGTGVGEAYGLSPASTARVANIATRGLIQPGDKLMIAGFTVQNGPVRVVIRAIGPSLVGFGISNALPDTTLQLRDKDGVLVRENNDWMSDQKAELEATSLQPTDDLEAAVVETIPPGQYTALVRGNPETTGVGVVQVYFLN